MSRDYLDIGPSPANEPCQQAPYSNPTQAREECQQFIIDIYDCVGQPPNPDTTYLTTKSFPHDFGRYYEVVVYFDSDDADSIDYAFRCENEAPANWSERALEALALVNTTRSRLNSL